MQLATEVYTVYRLYDTECNLLYIGCTKDLEQRMSGHRYQSAWYPTVAEVQTERFQGREAAAAAEQSQIRSLVPLYNRGAQRYAGPVAKPLDGERLQELREEANLSREALARRAHLSHRTVFRIEKGQTKQVHELTLMALAGALGVETHELLER